MEMAPFDNQWYQHIVAAYVMERSVTRA